MAYIGIDQSYTGFAITFLGDDGTHETLVQKFDPKKHGSGVDRLNVISAWLYDVIDKRQRHEMVNHVCMEGYAHGAKFGREQSGELGATVKRALRSTIPGMVGYPTIVAPTALKKYVTGKSTAKKNEILLATYRKWGVEFNDDNAADSYGLAQIAADIDAGTTDHAYEEEVVKSLRIHTESTK